MRSNNNNDVAGEARIVTMRSRVFIHVLLLVIPVHLKVGRRGEDTHVIVGGV